MNYKSILIAASLTLALVVWMATGTFIPGHAEAPPPAAAADARERPVMSVAVREVEAAPVVRALTVQGELLPQRRAELKAETAGRVEALLVERGSRVAEGQPLLRLAMDDRQARLEQARARIAQAESEYQAARRLESQGLQAETQVKAAFALLQEARAVHKAIELDIAHTTVRAPFAGILETRRVELGEYVGRGDPVAVLVDIQPLKVSVHVPQQQVTAIRPGQPAQVVLLTGGTLEATVTYVAATADPGTRTFTVELQVPNPQAALPAGLSAEVRLPLETVQGHFLSPALLSLDERGVLGVKAVDAAGVVRFHPATVVRSERDGVWVSGLPARLSVITVGQGFVRTGDRVKAVAEKPL